MNTAAVISHITKWLTDYVNQSAATGFAVGVSGGIDSAVTSALAAATGLPVVCLQMPIHQPPAHVSRAEQHIAWLKSRLNNVSAVQVDLTPVYESMLVALPTVDDEINRFLPLANSRARLRMTTLYYFAALHGYLVVGTGNKVEDFGVGFYTKYGDGGVDLSPIADLMKSEVYALAEALDVSEAIRAAQPSDGLWQDDRSDEDQIGASYPELEWAMHYKGGDDTLSARQKTVLQIYHRLHRANKHKMQPVPVCQVSAAIKQS